MKKTAQLFALAGVLALVQPASAQSVDGEVTKIDAEQNKITMRHGPIKNLDMDSMTMVFRVQDPAMLKNVKPGDKVLFEADRVNGQITVTKMQKK
jgi:Cu(I)/Ag(I) efflux system periplasmic protein CusF